MSKFCITRTTLFHIHNKHYISTLDKPLQSLYGSGCIEFYVSNSGMVDNKAQNPKGNCNVWRLLVCPTVYMLRQAWLRWRCFPTSSCFDSSSRHRWRAAQVSLESSLVSLAFSRRGAANAVEKYKNIHVQCIYVGLHGLCLILINLLTSF